MRAVAIIQARLASTRLPGKVLVDIAGKAMLRRVVERARRIHGVADVVVAIPRDEHDLNAWIRDELGICPVASSRHNVLRRYHVAAMAHDAEVVIRLTGDCPLLDPDMASLMLRTFKTVEPDYLENLGPSTDGFDVEIFSAKLLRRAHEEARAQVEREHVTPWMRAQRDIRRYHYKVPGPAVKLSVDTAEDLDLVRSVYAAVGTDVFGYDTVLAALRTITVKG